MKYFESQVDQVTKQIKNSRIKKLTVSTKYKVQSTKYKASTGPKVNHCAVQLTTNQGTRIATHNLRRVSSKPPLQQPMPPQ
jgi:hypothetical protein